MRFAVVDRVLMNIWHISDTVINPELLGNVRGEYLKFEPHKTLLYGRYSGFFFDLWITKSLLIIAL